MNDTLKHCGMYLPLFGYRAAEVLGANISILMPEPDRSAHDGYIARHLSTRVPHIIGRGREVEARRKDGSHNAIEALGEIARTPGAAAKKTPASCRSGSLTSLRSHQRRTPLHTSTERWNWESLARKTCGTDRRT